MCEFTLNESCTRLRLAAKQVISYPHKKGPRENPVGLFIRIDQIVQAAGLGAGASSFAGSPSSSVLRGVIGLAASCVVG